ncbi:hypothetical protein SAMN02745157_2122 [Kaistia soli DSM 19436]|uniref:ABC-type amino acid transport substrate-binding protein n=1 Tax=Kaistia soli DSM 19436 TaxID=1122133 RepID=A0A1M5AGA1_9HYPH|nr:hypothetical protein [Kaistia soli]SHF29320.1 hypothetical protein SAMN02745157_2122 [Kaistia soli DSM 19436]
MDTNSAYWPDSVPTTLWQYTALTPEAQRDFPFVGIAVSWEFVVAFLAGVVLICAFAWKRFAEPSYDVNTDAFRDFKKLKIWNLKDSESLRRAYVIYCILLIFIYAMLSFFGRVIFQLASQINVSGLQVSVGSVEFTSWRWPLLLAAGIGGLAPLLNPLIPAENMLRRFAHEIVGIPTRLREKATRIKTLIDGNPIEDPATLASFPSWVRKTLGPKLASYITLSKNLHAVVIWSRKENLQWSDPEIRRKLDEYEREVRDEAEDALALFDSLLHGSERLGESSDGASTSKNDEKLLLDTCVVLERIRDEFAIIMAIYVDYGSKFASLKDDLRETIISRFREEDNNPATGFPLYMLAVIYTVYFIFVWIQWHPPIFPVPLSVSNLALIAAAETTKLFILVWLPTTTIATLAEVADGRFSREGSLETTVLWRDIGGLLAALAISAGGMMLFAILKTALTSRNIQQMTQELLGSERYAGNLFFYVILAPISGICYLGINIVLRYPDKSFARRRLWIAAVAGIVTLVYLSFVASNLADVPCRRLIDDHTEPFDLSLWSMWWTGRDNLETCFTYYSTLDLLVISASVFISVIGLTRQHRRSQQRLEIRRQASSSKAAKAAAQAGVVAMVLLASGVFFGSVTPARAANPDGAQPDAVQSAPPTIVLGFRSDIPPFSFQPAGQRQDTPHPYLGYVAELCYQIFENSPWRIEQRVIDQPQSRFKRLRGPKDPSHDEMIANGIADDKIDVLCDATTLWLGDSERMVAGIFSPIIFVSGVSYLYRSAQQYNSDPVQIGYLASSTAERVAWEICSVDVLKVGASDKPATCARGTPLECVETKPVADGAASSGPVQTQTQSLRALSEISQSYVLCPRSSHDNLIAWFCEGWARDKIYVGDLDIIQAKEAEWRARGRDCPGVRPAGKTYTYEPYALLVSRHDTELVAFVQRRVYELFSHRSGARALFEKWFPGQNMSLTLAWLFLLNGVMDEGDMLRGPKGPP